MSIQISKVRGTKLQINPQIVKDQLQLYYDVNNINSYVSGTAFNKHGTVCIFKWCKWYIR